MAKRNNKVGRASSLPKHYFKSLPLVQGVILFVLTWILLPLTAFAPFALEPFLPEQILGRLVYYRTWFGLLFKVICGVHSLEVLYTINLCHGMGLTTWTTLKWAVNVALNGVFALRMLKFPDQPSKNN